MADAAKIIDRADKLLEKGKPEQALTELRSAIEQEPKNEALLQKAADLAMSLGQLGVTTDLLRKFFILAIENKQLSNGATAFRKLQRIKALDPEMVFRYAELCENTSRRDSAEAYRVAFQEFQRQGDGRRALDCITASLKIDPRLEDYREQARIAEALHEPVLAAEALVNMCVMLERMGEDASDLYARAYANDATNLAARLGHGRALIAHQRPAEAIELLQPLATYPSSPEEAREPYAMALLAVGRFEDAEPYAWGMFERNPSGNLPTLHAIIKGLIDRDRTDRALPLARRLEEFFRKSGRRSEFMDHMAQLAAESKPSIPFFEYLAELYNSANREADYALSLSRLFDLYFDSGNYSKALDSLDRAVDIDPYEAEHKERMNKLSGHVPEDRLQAVAKRLGIDPPEHVTVKVEEPQAVEAGPKVLEDLILQAELFLQYGLRDKALAKIEQIKHSFPEETDDDPRVRQLFQSAGLAVAMPRAQAMDHHPSDEAVVRAAEVGRIIAKQSDPRQVLVTAVNQIGGRWQYSRCLAALATPGRPPSLVVEYCAPEVPKSERSAMVRLLALSQRLTATEPVFRAADVQLSEQLIPIRQELAQLNINSLVALALVNDDGTIGLLIVQQCGARRRWSNEEVEVLRSLADQVAIAIHGARLRSLVSTLGVAEEKTGLLKRSAYTDAVVADVTRQRTANNFTSTLALLQVSELTADVEPEAAVAELVRTLRSVARDQAMPFRYDDDTVALLLPLMAVAETEALLGQLRNLLEPLAITIAAGIAQAAQSGSYEPEDAATEWINRVAHALILAGSTAEKLCTLPPTPASVE